MKFLSEEFLSAPGLNNLPALAGGFSGAIQWSVNGGPDGDLKVLTTFEGGRLTQAQLANDTNADIALTIGFTDALGVLGGEVDLNVLFMTGQMKTAGITGPLVDLIVAVRSPQGRQALDALSALVDR